MPDCKREVAANDKRQSIRNDCPKEDEKQNKRYHDVRVRSPEGKIFPTEVYIDGEKMNGVRGLEYSISVDKIPIIRMEMFGNEIECNGEVVVKDIRQSIQAVRLAFLTDSVLYGALVSSIEGAMRETTIAWEEWEYEEAAKKIADRIIGAD